MFLQKNFLDELFKWSLQDDYILQLILKEITSEDIPKELKNYDAILSIIKKRSRKDQELSLGIIQQDFFELGLEDDLIFDRINNTKLGSKDLFLTRLSEFVKQVRTVQLYEDFGDDFNKQDKQAAIEGLIKKVLKLESIDFNEDELEFSNPFLESIDLLKKSYQENKSGNNFRLPFFIKPLDDLTNGGVDKKDTVLVILRSGEGKSTMLKNFGYNFIRNGYSGIHFQLEGGANECKFKYNQLIHRIPYSMQQKGLIPNKELKKRYWYESGKINSTTDYAKIVELNDRIIKAYNKDLSLFDLTIYSFEDLGNAKLTTMELKIEEWVESHGKNPDFIIFDSVDLMMPEGKFGFDTASVKSRIQHSAQWIKNISTKYDTRGYASIQTSEIPMEKWNDPDFVITRSHALGDKNIVNPFSVVFSGNRTLVEKSKNLARIYADKLRHSFSGHPVVNTFTSFNTGKYFDIPNTIKKFYSDEN